MQEREKGAHMNKPGSVFLRLAHWRAARRMARQALQVACQQRSELMADLAACRSQLQQADMQFNLAGEPEQVESCIYQYCALQARYQGLMRRARQSGLTAAALQPPQRMPAAPAYPVWPGSAAVPERPPRESLAGF